MHIWFLYSVECAELEVFPNQIIGTLIFSIKHINSNTSFTFYIYSRAVAKRGFYYDTTGDYNNE